MWAIQQARLRRRHRPELLGHLPQQLHEERPRAGRRCPRPSWSGSGTPSTTTRRREITVDVERLLVEVPAIGLVEPFPIDPATQERYLDGLDDVGITLRHESEIDAFETTRPAWLAARA